MVFKGSINRKSLQWQMHSLYCINFKLQTWPIFTEHLHPVMCRASQHAMTYTRRISTKLSKHFWLSSCGLPFADTLLLSYKKRRWNVACFQDRLKDDEYPISFYDRHNNQTRCILSTGIGRCKIHSVPKLSGSLEALKLLGVRFQRSSKYR
jgi:hypothetical protein